MLIVSLGGYMTNWLSKGGFETWLQCKCSRYCNATLIPMTSSILLHVDYHTESNNTLTPLVL